MPARCSPLCRPASSRAISMFTGRNCPTPICRVTDMSKISTETQAVDFVRAARADRTPFEIVAGGTRRGVGKPVGDIAMLDVSGLSGVIKYEPGELILTAAPSTPL